MSLSSVSSFPARAGAALSINQLGNGFLVYSLDESKTSSEYMVYEDTVDGLVKMYKYLLRWPNLALEEQEAVLVKILSFVKTRLEIKQRSIDQKPHIEGPKGVA